MVAIRVQMNLSFGFSNAVGSASDTSNDKALYQPIIPVARQSDLREIGCEKEKKTLPPALPNSCTLPCVTTSRLENINIIQSLIFSDPCPTAVHMKPFPASVFKALMWIFATTTKIGTRSCFTQASAKSFTANLHDLLLIAASCKNHDGVSVRRLSAIHFRGKSIRQVGCYTLLSGFRLPWPPSCC